MSWLNMDASIGFHYNCFDSNSNCFYQLREDSLEEHPPLFQEQPLHQSYIYEHTLNFSNAPLFYKEQFNQDSHVSMKFPKLEDESLEWTYQGNTTRKGLKCLAELLLKILGKKSLQQAEIVSLIEGILCKGKHEESGKEEKNIKRRIYDALNVMIAAGLLEKVDSSIRLKEKPSTVYLQFQPLKIEETQIRVEKKRELLGRLISKKIALEYWIERNKARSEEISSKNQLAFPLIFVMKEDESFWMNYASEFILMKGKDLQFFSETDLLENVYQLQAGQSNLLISDPFK